MDALRRRGASLLREGGCELTGADLFIDSDLPIGAGLSSSASLELGVPVYRTSHHHPAMRGGPPSGDRPGPPAVPGGHRPGGGTLASPSTGTSRATFGWRAGPAARAGRGPAGANGRLPGSARPHSASTSASNASR